MSKFQLVSKTNKLFQVSFYMTVVQPNYPVFFQGTDTQFCKTLETS